MMQAEISNANSQTVPPVTVGPLSIDRAGRFAQVAGVEVTLSPAEFATLLALIDHRETPMSREALAHALSQGGSPRDAKLVDILICRLRRKFDVVGLPDLIRTVWGRGYLVSRMDRVNVEPSPSSGERRLVNGTVLARV